MLHIFAEPGDISGDRLTITGKEYNHIRNVLRMKQGEIISVSDGQDGRDYRFAIDGFTDSQVLCRLVSVAESGAELPVRVVLFQGIPKGDKMDLIVGYRARGDETLRRPSGRRQKGQKGPALADHR